MNNKELLAKYKKLEKIHNATNSAVRELEKQREELEHRNNLLTEANTRLMSQLATQKRITEQTLNSVNMQNNQYLERIKELEAI